MLAQPPAEGADPEKLTRQFLLACADPDNDFAVARSFLAPDARQKWDPTARVTIYDGDVSSLNIQQQNGAVTVAAPQTSATIVHGTYQLGDGGVPPLVRFPLTKVEGEWRFRDIPDGVLLSSSLLFAFKPVDLYFFDPTLQHLVPDRVFLVATRGNLAEAALQTLMGGPSPRLQGVVRTALPPGSKLSGHPALHGGVLDVEITTDARQVNRAGLAAQLLWTVGQLPEVSGVRLTVDGTPYTSGSNDVLTTDDALRYDPNVLSSTAPAYYVVATRARSVLHRTDGEQWPFVGAGRALRHPAVSLDARVAGLACRNAVCRRLYLGALGTSPLRRGLSVRGSLTAPTWDAVGGSVWTVENTPAGPVVWRVPAVGAPRRVDIAGVGIDRVRALRLSRDGTRVAAVVEHRGVANVWAGVVVRVGDAIRIDRLIPVAPSLVGVIDLGWADAGHLAVLAKSDPQGSVTPYRLRIDGSEPPQPVLATAPGGQPVSLAAAPGGQLLVATLPPGRRDGTRLLQLQNQTWAKVTDSGSDPVYAG